MSGETYNPAASRTKEVYPDVSESKEIEIRCSERLSQELRSFAARRPLRPWIFSCIIPATTRSVLCICAAVLFSALKVYSQTPISETCAKASLTAVQEILKDWKSTTAKSSYANMKAKCKNNSGEGSAMILVYTVKLAKENNRPMPASCTQPIENAFHSNTTLDDPPESCVTGDKN